MNIYILGVLQFFGKLISICSCDIWGCYQHEFEEMIYVNLWSLELVLKLNSFFVETYEITMDFD